MADLWYPRAVREECSPDLWGPVFDSLEKHCLHTTEGSDGGDPYIDAHSYGEVGHPYHPNQTLCVKDGRWTIAQHIPTNRGARALINGNGDRVSQTEIAWQAHRIGELPQEAFDVLGQLLAWEHETLGLPLQCGVTFYGENAGWTLATPSARQRLSFPAFDAYRGLLGHQHVPGDNHWDPGAIDIHRLLEAANNIGGDDVASQMPLIKKGDQTHGRFVHLACTALADRGWPMPVSAHNDATFAGGITVVQMWARAVDPSMPVDGVLGPRTWPAVLGIGPYSKLALPKFKKEPVSACSK